MGKPRGIQGETRRIQGGTGGPQWGRVGGGQGEEVDEELEEVSGGTVDEDKEIDVDGEEEEEA